MKRGLSYGAGSSIAGGAGIGSLVASAQTKHPSAGEVAQLFLTELEKLASGPLTDAELSVRKAALLGPYVRGMETTGGLAGTFGALASLGLPLSEAGAFVGRVQAARPADMKALVGRRLDSRYASVIIVGDAGKFLPDLKKRLGGSVTVIPRARLNLESPTLL